MKMPPGWKQDDRIKRKLSSDKKLKLLEERKALLERNHMERRAKAIQAQIDRIKRES